VGGRFLRFTIHGSPVSWKRAGRKGSSHTFTPKDVAIWENFVRLAALEAMQGAEHDFPLDTPLSLEARFYLKRPKKSKKHPIHPAGRPDLDNLLKALKDGLTLAGVWTDDARVCGYTGGTAKYWAEPGENGYVDVWVREIEEEF